MVKKQLISASILVLLFSITSCRKIVYEETYSFDNYLWSQLDTARFEVELRDTSRVMDMGFTLRHTGDYPYANLWLFLEVHGPEGHHVVDTLELFIAEPGGRWYGKKRFGYYKVDALYQHQISVAQPGLYQFSVVQGMRRLQLPQVKSVEFWIQNH